MEHAQKLEVLIIHCRVYFPELQIKMEADVKPSLVNKKAIHHFKNLYSSYFKTLGKLV
ncbi:unnamed protein product [Clavelina lepadiformis]|uniref:Uncharacterized protein n=1 Tax=Clavelina lepadiformis TaxID=159417 RepID=A0ABP0F0P1_CLALP